MKPHERVSFSQRAMQFKPLVRIYERVWRPLAAPLVGGFTLRQEMAQLFNWLSPEPDARLLDLACGPGNFTRELARLVPEGFVVGADFSEPMLRRAVAHHRHAPRNVAYIRADAHTIPFPPASLDGVNCAGALHLFRDPDAVLAELCDALRPGAPLAVMTVTPHRRPRGPDVRRLLGRAGVRAFEEGELAGMLQRAGFEGLETQVSGWVLLFTATRRKSRAGAGAQA